VREDARRGRRGGEPHRRRDQRDARADDEHRHTIDELQRSVGQISQILNVIEEVTNRTNLLSLNAAIIAAQAGEQGAGFTVVADEIRELAERTRGSTKEIGTIIKAVQGGSRRPCRRCTKASRVTDNVKLAQDAAASLAKIVDSATRSFEMATRISRALERAVAGEPPPARGHVAHVGSHRRDQPRHARAGPRHAAHGAGVGARARHRRAGEERDRRAVEAGKGITVALEKIADDARAMRDLLERQLQETDRIADASRVMLDIARRTTPSRASSTPPAAEPRSAQRPGVRC
jgi:methyl-accepting chemotaxis protein